MAGQEGAVGGEVEALEFPRAANLKYSWFLNEGYHKQDGDLVDGGESC